MHSWLVALAASVATFAATNVDDFFLLTLFFARRIPARRIIAGQYLGFAAIIVVTLIGIGAALTVSRRWIHALGLLPIVIGLKQLSVARKNGLEGARRSNAGVVSIAFLVFSNGADNIGIYIPFFVVGRARLWLILSVYALLVAIWCFIGNAMGNHPPILREVDRWGHWVVPTVLIALGIYVLNA